MKPPIWQPQEQTSDDRRHYDSPTLWYSVILGSVAIHLSGLGVLGVLLNAGFFGLHSGKQPVSIDVIAIAPRQPKEIIAPSPTARPIAPKTIATPIKKTAITNKPAPNRKPSSSKASTKPSVSPQPNKKQTPKTNIKKSPTSNSSGKVPPKTQPTAPTGKTNPVSTPASPTTSPSPSPTPNNSPSGGGFIAFPGKITLIPSGSDILHPGNPNYNDKPAELLDSSKQLSAAELKQLGISTERDLELMLKIVVKTDGTAEVFSAQVVRGNISQSQAIALANKIVPQWRFEPTKMAGGKVYGNYFLPVTIRPVSG